MTACTQDDVPVLHASLNYLDQMLERPRFHVHERDRDNVRLISHTVPVADARRCNLALEEQGFCLVPHRSAVSNLRSRKELLRVYRREVESLLCRLTGASHAIAGAIPVLRVAEDLAHEAERAVHRPIRMVHSDCTPQSAEWSARSAFGEDAADLVRGKRHALYHTWRVLNHAPHDAPLALCDARTVCADDGVAADTVLDFPKTPRREMETTLFRFNPQHRWFYFPDMSPDEILIFKDFDSDPARVCGVPHTAFEDSRCPRGTPPRSSLDLQVLAIFD